LVPEKYSTVSTTLESTTNAASSIFAGARNVWPFIGYNNFTMKGTMGGVGLTTLMVTGGEVAIIPALSVATAVSIYLPSATLLHTRENGLCELVLVSQMPPVLVTIPRLLVPAKYSTVSTKLESITNDCSSILAGARNVWPFIGYNNFTMKGTVGGVGLTTLILTGGEVAIMPALSVATAVSIYLPSATLLHTRENGLCEVVLVNQIPPVFVTTPKLFVPEKYSTVSTKFESTTTGCNSIFAGARNVWPFIGYNNFTLKGTVGGVGLTTPMLTGGEVTIIPALSVATAVSVYLPSATLLHTSEKGLREVVLVSQIPPVLVTIPSLFVPAKYSTVSTKLESTTDACSSILAGARKTWSFKGYTIRSINGCD